MDSPKLYSKDKKVDSSYLGAETSPIPTDNLSADISIAKQDMYLVEETSKTLKDWYENYLMLNEEDRLSKILFCDTETTHFNGFAVSIALIEVDLSKKEITRTFYKEFNPQVVMDPEAIEVHGITEEQIKDAPIITESFEEIDSFVKEAEMFGAFNAIYDMGVLVREYERQELIMPSLPYIDIMKRLKNQVNAKAVNGRLKDPKLSEAAEYFGVDFDSSTLHNALYDTEVLVKVFLAALRSYEQS